MKELGTIKAFSRRKNANISWKLFKTKQWLNHAGICPWWNLLLQTPCYNSFFPLLTAGYCWCVGSSHKLQHHYEYFPSHKGHTHVRSLLNLPKYYKETIIRSNYSLPVHLFVVYHFKRVDWRQVHEIGLMRTSENSCFSCKLLLLHAVFYF